MPIYRGSKAISLRRKGGLREKYGQIDNMMVNEKSFSFLSVSVRGISVIIACLIHWMYFRSFGMNQ